MRILHVPHGYWPARGGAEDLTTGLSEGLASLGHDVHVVVMDLATPEGLYRFGVPSTGEGDGVRNGVTVVRVDAGAAYRVGGLLPGGDPYRSGVVAARIRSASLARLESVIRSHIETFEPDVVMTTPHLFENVRATFAIHDEVPFPLVWMPLLHEADPNWPFEDVRRRLEDADAVIALTDHEGERFVDGYGVDRGRVFVLPPAVDLPRVACRDATVPIVMFLGRLTMVKGIELLCQAMSTVWDAIPEAKLVIAGAGGPDRDATKKAVERLAGAPGHDSVEFAVDISDERKAELLEEASVLVLPSRVESFGIVLLEAWAHGRPVIAIDTPVMRSVVDDGADGVLVPPSPTALGGVIARLLGDPEEANAMGAAGRAKVEAHHTWDVAAARLEAVYEDVLARRRPR
jgi:glycosyltransferase involved in cell wall biosynthesis